jgi:NADH-quinone oxidoreductase subunit A
MTELPLAGYLLLFVFVGFFFVFFHLLLGKQVRPAKPNAEKLTIYECGEPTIGSAWVQFDLRFYVVALLFVIFDVEVVFFFPWAVVFGRANTVATLANKAELSQPERDEYNRAVQELVPAYPENTKGLTRYRQEAAPSREEVQKEGEGAHQLAWLAFWDILVFFGVLLVGFAYLWKRGDLDWVRSTLAERASVSDTETASPAGEAQELVGVGQGG